jgi:hypothetical protein
VQVEYPEFVQIMTTKLDKQNEDAYAPKDDSMHKTMILNKLSTQIMNFKNIWTCIVQCFCFVAVFLQLGEFFFQIVKKYENFVNFGDFSFHFLKYK